MDDKKIQLPNPSLDSDFSIEQALKERRSVREYADNPFSLQEATQLLWSCQGITKVLEVSVGKFYLRTSPSAGALYPLEIYLIAKNVDSIEKGVYHYVPGNGIGEHYLEAVKIANVDNELTKSTLEQSCVRDCAAAIVITSFNDRVATKYGERAERYCQIEVGHAAQNVCLQAQSLDIGVVTVGAFHDDKMRSLLDTEAEIYYLLCLGKNK